MLNFNGQQIIDYQSPMADSSRWRIFQIEDSSKIGKCPSQNRQISRNRQIFGLPASFVTARTGRRMEDQFLPP